MPTFNCEKYISYAINSILQQSYTKWELFVVDDCSTDNTKFFLSKIFDKRIKIIILRKRVGPYIAINNVLKKCRGEYIAFLDSDDVAHKDRLKFQVNFLNKNADTTLVASKFKKIDENNAYIKNKTYYISPNELKIKFPCENLICNSSVMFRKNILNEIKFLNKKYFYSNDYFFYLKIFKNNKIKILNRILVFYREHNFQRTKEKQMQKKIILENFKNLNWSKKNGLVNKKNFHFYYKTYIKNLCKLLYLIIFRKL